MSFNSSPYKPRPPPGQPGSSPFRSSSANKFRSSLVPLSRPSPARPLKSPTKLAKTPTAARNLFDTSAPRSESITQFAPDLPAEVTRFTPRIRKFARKGVSSGMSNINSTQPFEMKIPSPDPGLTGEALAKEVPDDPTRAGSIYADEFLAHKCPAHFDDLQRRQFFCILDLRRLKYAADEIFSKKDWKLNVLSFAREFEKSRSLILLRYGLYEFKTVRPSAEVLQNWRSAYGIHSEPEGLTRASPAGRRTPGQAKSIKRKAEEDLAPNDAALTASTSNKNKRRNVNQEASKHDNESTPFRASKRKVEVSDEENEPQQKKLAKSTPTATSIFESILNKTRSAVSSPAKPTPESSSLGVSKPLQPSNGSLLFGSAKTIDVDTPSIPAKSSESVLFGHKVGSAPVVNTGNIFSYLSESPGSSSSNDDDEGRETNFEPEHDSEEQGQSTAVSTGTSTPPVQNGASSFTSKVKDAHGISGGSSKPSSQSGKGGLFDRITMGPDSQPVRASPSPDDKQESAKESLVAPGKQTAKQTATPAKQPGDYTFNPSTTPISFSQPSTDVTKTSVAATVGPSEKLVKSDVPEPKAPVSIFGASTQATSAPKSSEAAVSIFDTPKPAPTSSTSIFGAASTPAAKPKSSETPISIFDPQNLKPAPASVSFGAPSTPAAKPKSSETPISIFDPQNLKPAPTSVSFGAASTPATKPKSSDAPISIFDPQNLKSAPASGSFGAPSTPAAKPKSSEASVSIFDQKPAPTSTSIFGAASTPAAKPKSSEASVSIFDQKPAPTSTSIFGAASTPAAKPKSSEAPVSIFDAQKPAPASASIFEAASTPAAHSQSDKTKLADEGSSTATAKQAISIFDKPAVTTATASETKPRDDQGASDTPAANGQVPNIFDKAFIASNGARTKALSDNLKPVPGFFSRSTNPLFAGPKAHENNSAGAKSTVDQDSKSNSGEKLSTASESNKENLGSGKEVKAPASITPAVPIFGTQGVSQSAAPVSTTSFGEKKTDNSAKPAPVIFGSSAPANGAIFSFGSEPKSNVNTQSSSASFPAPATPATSISFGAPSSQLAGGSKKPDFQFGNAGQSAGSSSFTFGQSSSAGGGFTFTAGADGKSVNNPFSAPQASAQTSTPVFGGNASAPTPFSSFGSSFGVAPASQGKSLFGGPSHTNGNPSFSKSTPSFSLSQPVQSQNTSAFMGAKASNIFKPPHAGGEASTDGNLPFPPPPSSIGTTPVSGTPEPEAAHEDGEEARHTQISLTEGGPGEEDEVIIHEVRAKALKYVPVVQDGDDEEKKQSPWSTQGVGPLRILKNKSTGAVRMLLRAEPRGHIAMNKMVLSDVEYKVEKKTVHFAAAKDDASGLETWVLQVKTPSFAQELAGVLEANKGSNKK